MRIGLLADIHSHLPNLEACLDELAKRECDTIIQLGDTVTAGEDPTEVVSRLLDAGITDGVWGNHDFGLMHKPPRRLLKLIPRPIRSFLKNQQPALRFAHANASLYASHIDPDLDPFTHEDLWNQRRPPKTETQLARLFRARPETYLVTAHRHRWFAATPEGPVSFQRQMTLQLGTDRWFLVIDAVKNGWAAVLDLEQRVLERIRVRPTG